MSELPEYLRKFEELEKKQCRGPWSLSQGYLEVCDDMGMSRVLSSNLACLTELQADFLILCRNYLPRIIKDFKILQSNYDQECDRSQKRYDRAKNSENQLFEALKKINYLKNRIEIFESSIRTKDLITEARRISQEALLKTIEQLQKDKAEMIKAIDEYLEDGCECGFEEPMGEGYTEGTCYWHEVLGRIKEREKK